VRIVGLIPARAGSKRIPGKNTKLLGGKPLIQWTIEAAKASGVFEHVVVSTEDVALGERAWRQWDVRWHRRPSAFAADDSQDIQWVRHALDGCDFDAFAILRPTSPFRTADTIRRAVTVFKTAQCSSMRAVERVKQHPGKMWCLDDYITAPSMSPLLDTTEDGTPWHSRPTQSLPTIYIQNSSLEIAWTWCVTTFDSISGPKVAPFFTEGMEGFSIDYPEDWERAERYVASLQATAAAE
jgi:CMP-N,N'-diacetyllegionaminic acid synthase